MIEDKTEDEEFLLEHQERIDEWDAIWKARTKEVFDNIITRRLLLEASDRLISWEILIATLKGEPVQMEPEEMEEKCGRCPGWIRKMQYDIRKRHKTAGITI